MIYFEIENYYRFIMFSHPLKNFPRSFQHNRQMNLIE